MDRREATDGEMDRTGKRQVYKVDRGIINYLGDKPIWRLSHKVFSNGTTTSIEFVRFVLLQFFSPYGQRALKTSTPYGKCNLEDAP